jgi:hypothetical protein
MILPKTFDVKTSSLLPSLFNVESVTGDTVLTDEICFIVWTVNGLTIIATDDLNRADNHLINGCNALKIFPNGKVEIWVSTVTEGWVLSNHLTNLTV